MHKIGDDVFNILRDNGIVWKNGAVMGGKTKKTYRKDKNNKKNKMNSRRKKQKGGFTYNKPSMLFNKNSTYKSSAKSSVARGRKSVKKTIR